MWDPVSKTPNQTIREDSSSHHKILQEKINSALPQVHGFLYKEINTHMAFLKWSEHSIWLFIWNTKLNEVEFFFFMNTKLLFWKVPNNLGSYCPPQWDGTHTLLLSRELMSEEGYFTVDQLDKLWGQMAKVNTSKLAALYGRGQGQFHSCSFPYDPNRTREKLSANIQQTSGAVCLSTESLITIPSSC